MFGHQCDLKIYECCYASSTCAARIFIYVRTWPQCKYSYRSVILVYNLLPNVPFTCLQNDFFLTTQTNPEWMFWPPLFDKRPSISPLLCSPDIFTFHPRYGIVPHISYFCISTFSCFQIFICQWVLILACPTYLC